jgi:hypothetical protein
MSSTIGELQPTLADAGRLPRVTSVDRLSLAEVGVLALAGLATACGEAWIHLSLKVPGHAILRAIVPMMVGLALVPRRGAGTAMGFFAGAGALLLNCLPGEGISIASGIAMILVGPAIDLALIGAKASYGLYARFAAAGVLANLAALAIKVLAINAGLLVQKEPLATYLVRAFPSYLICGAIAGLIGGAVCFRARPTEYGEPHS